MIWNRGGEVRFDETFLALDGEPPPEVLDPRFKRTTDPFHEVMLADGRVFVPRSIYRRMRALHKDWMNLPHETYVNTWALDDAALDGSHVTITDEGGRPLTAARTTGGTGATLTLSQAIVSRQFTPTYVMAEAQGFFLGGTNWKPDWTYDAASYTLRLAPLVAQPRDDAGGNGAEVRVEDATDRRPMVGVRVLVLGDDGRQLTSATTEADGVARLRSVRPDERPACLLTTQDKDVGPYFISGLRWQVGRRRYLLLVPRGCDKFRECPWS
jgi:hypothetical protein